MNLDPIFIHASPRSGSTYFFNVLRRNPSLMCFNEAISDVYHITKKPKWPVHHDFLEKDDLAELRAAWDIGIIPPPYLAFYKYHELTPELETYIARLIAFAQICNRRPVFCEIYSRYRVRALREKFGGYHIAQVRDFMPQFGSFVRALVEGGEWGFLALPWLEIGKSGIDAIAAASKESMEDLVDVHSCAWADAKSAVISASDMTFDLDTIDKRIICMAGVEISFHDYKKYPDYPIPTESEWREIVRRHRPTFKIAAAKLLSSVRLYDKLSQWRRQALYRETMRGESHQSR